MRLYVKKARVFQTKTSHEEFKCILQLDTAGERRLAAMTGQLLPFQVAACNLVRFDSELSAPHELSFDRFGIDEAVYEAA